MAAPSIVRAEATPVFARLPAVVLPLGTEIEPLDIWGTCYFYFGCQGNPIGLGKTGAECRAQNGHSLLLRDGRCYSL